MPITNSGSMQSLYPATIQSTPSLSITGALLHQARNTQEVLGGLAETVPVTFADAYKDLVRKACDTTFKNKVVANLIASKKEADPVCLQVMSINLFLLNEVPGAGKKVKELQKKLNDLGEKYTKIYKEQFDAGKDIFSFVAAHDLKNSKPYDSHCKLTKELNKLVRAFPDAYDHARRTLHQNYLREGLVGSFQGVHGITLDQISVENICREGNGSAQANTVLEKQFARAKSEPSGASLYDTVLVSLSQLDLDRKMVDRVIVRVE